MILRGIISRRNSHLPPQRSVKLPAAARCVLAERNKEEGADGRRLLAEGGVANTTAGRYCCATDATGGGRLTRRSVAILEEDSRPLFTNTTGLLQWLAVATISWALLTPTHCGGGGGCPLFHGSQSCCGHEAAIDVALRRRRHLLPEPLLLRALDDRVEQLSPLLECPAAARVNHLCRNGRRVGVREDRRRSLSCRR